MLINHNLGFLQIDFFTKSSRYNSWNNFSIDFTWTVCVEQSKDTLKARDCEYILGLNCSTQKLTVVDLIGIVKVNLVYNILNLLTTYVQSFGMHNLVQFLSSDHSISVFVNSLELIFKFFHLFLTRYLYK